MKIQIYRVTVAILGVQWTHTYLGRPTETDVLVSLKVAQAQKLKDTSEVGHPRVITEYQRYRDLILEYGLFEDELCCKHLGVTVGTIKVKPLLVATMAHTWIEALA
jgi:hypothetical protein